MISGPWFNPLSNRVSKKRKLASIFTVLLLLVLLVPPSIQVKGVQGNSTTNSEKSLDKKDYGLRLFSSPPGAEVSIDGTWYGSTPLYLKVEEGRHHIEYRRKYFETQTQDFIINDPMTLECQMVLEEEISKKIPLVFSIAHYRMSGSPPSPELGGSSALAGRIINYLDSRGFTVLNLGKPSRLLGAGEIMDIIESGNMEPVKALSGKYPEAKFLVIGESFNTSQENPNPNFDGFTVRGRVELWLADMNDYNFYTSKGTRLSVVSDVEWTEDSLVKAGKKAIDYFIERLAEDYIPAKLMDDNNSSNS